jgi:5-bromo-4-chloroindolyl phosphate hydrolysis protein
LVIERSKNDYDKLRSELGDREQDIRALQKKDFSNSDAIAALGEKLIELSKQIVALKKCKKHPQPLTTL